MIENQVSFSSFPSLLLRFYADLWGPTLNPLGALLVWDLFQPHRLRPWMMMTFFADSLVRFGRFTKSASSQRSPFLGRNWMSDQVGRRILDPMGNSAQLETQYNFNASVGLFSHILVDKRI